MRAKYFLQVRLLTEHLYPDKLAMENWVGLAYKKALKWIGPQLRTRKCRLRLPFQSSNVSTLAEVQVLTLKKKCYVRRFYSFCFVSCFISNVPAVAVQ